GILDENEGGRDSVIRRDGENYRKLIFQGNRLMGAVMIGYLDEAGLLGHIIEMQESSPELRKQLEESNAFLAYVIDVLGYREGNIIDLRDAGQAELLATFGTDKTHEGRLNNWVRRGQSDVVVFYSGHGVPGLKDRRGYLLPVDGDPNLPEINGYAVDLLYENLEKIGARSVTVFLDACFSGDSQKGMLIRATSGLNVAPRLPTAATTLTVLTAAQGDQLASWDEDAKLGLFTKHLLEALYGAADGAGYGDGDGEVTVAEVKAYLDREMTYQARRRYGREQTATVLGDVERVLASITPGAAIEPVAAPPLFTVEEMDLDMYTLKNARVRAGPSATVEVLTTLDKGSRVIVTGKVEDRNWYRVALADGDIGFIFGKLLGEDAPEELQTVTVVPGGSFFDSATSFAMIRGGHIDVAVLGAFQVSANGDLANWMLPQRGVGNVGGAMDLAAGAKRIIVAMEHTDRNNNPKIVNECSFPLTGRECVSMIVTDIAVISVSEGGLTLLEVAPAWDAQDVQELTEPKLQISPDLSEIGL
ncbi:MAG: SH3 domain-containing protein, partial [Chloroflexi bacterium]|nr:SH3 domain-containing protein [Chloroflexota bacterium]